MSSLFCIRANRLWVAMVMTPLTSALATPSCGGHSQEDATTFCDQEQTALKMCFSEQVYEQCMTCYQECGVDCDRKASCPEAYFCRDD